MPTIQISNFTGIIPRTGDTNLANNEATTAVNVKLASGEIRAWKKPVSVYKVKQDSVVSIFKLDSSSGSAVWCEWTTDTDVCFGPIADDGESRIYYTEGGVAKKTNYELATTGTGAYPRDWLYMGVPYPAKAPTVETVEPATQEEAEDRVYCYTYVSKFGDVEEESAPSEGAEITCSLTSGDPVYVGGFVDPPTDHYNITKIRIYRSVTGTSAVSYMFVDEINLADHKMPKTGTSLNGVAFDDYAYPDTMAVEALGKTLDSEYYTPPPEGMSGLVSMPNGFFAGFLNNQVWFSEPYLPHAWPSEYMLTVDSPIVGLGVYGATLVVCTTRQPYTISGTHPAAMTQEKQPMIQPCVSKRSIAYDQYGVLYASSYGLVALAAGQMDVFTRPLATADDWAEYNPASMTAVMYNNLYMAAYRSSEGNKMLVFSRADTPALVEYELRMSAGHIERGTGALYYLNTLDDTIYQIDASTINKTRYTWASKLYVFPYWTTFSAMKLDAVFDDGFDAEAYEEERQAAISYNQAFFNSGADDNGALNMQLLNGHTAEYVDGEWVEKPGEEAVVAGSLLKSVPEKADVRNVQVTLIADGKRIYTKVFDSCQAVRTPPVKAHTWQFEIQGTVDVEALTVGTSMADLYGGGA